MYKRKIQINKMYFTFLDTAYRDMRWLFCIFKDKNNMQRDMLNILKLKFRSGSISNVFW